MRCTSSSSCWASFSSMADTAASERLGQEGTSACSVAGGTRCRRRRQQPPPAYVIPVKRCPAQQHQQREMLMAVAISSMVRVHALCSNLRSARASEVGEGVVAGGEAASGYTFGAPQASGPFAGGVAAVGTLDALAAAKAFLGSRFRA